MSSPPQNCEMRMPPQDLGAENAVLLGLLAGDCAELVLAIVRPDDFYHSANVLRMQAVADLFDQGKPLDVVLLGDELERKGLLDKAGGRDGLLLLAENSVTTANVEHHAGIVRDKRLRRDLLDSGRRTVEAAYNGRALPDVIEDIEQAVARVKRAATTHKTRASFRTLADLNAEPPQMPREIVGQGVLIAETLAMLSAPAKSMKTHAIANLACSVASGQPWIGFPTHGPYPVGILSLEGGTALIYDRLRKVSAGMNLRPEDLARVHVWEVDESEWPAVDDPAYVADLAADLKDIKPGLIILDPLIEAHSQDENSASEMRNVTLNLRRLAQMAGACVLMVHHTRKPSTSTAPDPYEARGSGVLFGAVASAIALEKRKDIADADGNERTGIRLAFSLRYAAGPEDIRAYLDPETGILIFAGEVHTGNLKHPIEEFRAFVAQHPLCGKKDVQDALGMAGRTFDLKRKAGEEAGWLHVSTGAKNRLVLSADPDSEGGF